MMRSAAVLASTVVLLLTAAAPARAVDRIGSLATARIGTDWTLDGDEMISARAKLENDANFGPAGIHPEDVQIIDVVGPLTSTLLNTFDVFFVGYVPDGTLADSELLAIASFVYSGGSLLVTCDSSGFDDVCAYFGKPAVGGVSNPVRGTTAGFEQGLYNGPFGVVGPMPTAGNSAHFGDVVGISVLARDAAEQPIVALQGLGFGRIVFLTDVDLISDFGGLSPGAAIDLANPKDVLLVNLFAFGLDVCGGPVLCVGADDRFFVLVHWDTGSSSGVGTATRLTRDSGDLWFFRGDNVEMIVKVIDGCAVNNRFWVFAGGLTNVAVHIMVVDRNGTLADVQEYDNPLGTPFQPIQDTEAFATCP